MKQYFVYIVANEYNTRIYIGVTNNIRRRVLEHKQKLNNGFTAKNNCTKLVWYEIHTQITEAIRREKQLKKWLRRWKNELIEKQNPSWLDLSSRLVIPAKAGTI